MKTLLFSLLVHLPFAGRLWSQAPAPSPLPSADRVVVAVNSGRPELVPYTAGMKFYEAISAAGGLTEFANIRYIDLIRCGKKEKIDMKTLRSDPTKEPTLQPWDIIYLPPAVF